MVKKKKKTPKNDHAMDLEEALSTTILYDKDGKVVYVGDRVGGGDPIEEDWDLNDPDVMPIVEAAGIATGELYDAEEASAEVSEDDEL